MAHARTQVTPRHAEIEHEQTRLIRAFIQILAVFVLLTIPGTWLTPGPVIGRWIISGAAVPQLLLLGAALVALRRGRLRLAVLITVGATMLFQAVAMLPNGLAGAGPVLLIFFTLPVALATVLTSWRVLAATISGAIAIVTALAILQQLPTPLAGFAPVVSDPMGTIILAFSFGMVALGLFLAYFGRSLRTTLDAALARERELEALRGTLEATVDVRTAELARALADGRAREARLEQTVAELQAARATVRALSVPIIPVLPGALVIPLVGALDAERVHVFTEAVLAAATRESVHTVILDITGVDVVDTVVAAALLRTAAVLRLIGAHVKLVGVRPEVAQTVIALGADLGNLMIYPRLQEAVHSLLMAQGLRAAA
jgi:anti-anti-sigma factor